MTTPTDPRTGPVAARIPGGCTCPGAHQEVAPDAADPAVWHLTVAHHPECAVLAAMPERRVDADGPATFHVARG
ncbi:hypothetical protein [Pseudonocardia sp. MH-G8]|uniref:hypothetical protein n=1 Tax=Pseudonocardia sp. MH-G8 TaxID=1854588 RepID=UPI000BA0C58E|nr:hypothetical protein [Pseudonocardia sp. MH-G8]OZM81197.1 hypothetical protein CFP66_17655 [Pseudonocardia sp. MH-G8]